MENRPQIQVELTGIALVVDRAGWFALILLWMVTIAGYFGGPDTIPTHFNGSGLADRFGEKSSILFIPAIGSILFLAITMLTTIPHKYNYLVTITNENAVSQYRLATLMLRYLRLSFALIFNAIVLMTILTAKGISDGVGFWFLPVTIVLIFVPVFFFIWKSIRNR